MGVNISNIIQSLKNDKYYSKRIEYIHKYISREANHKELKEKLPFKLEQYLIEKEIKLYSHQVDSIEKIRKGENILITTTTASGKTLCFNLPIFEKFINKKNISALYIYPTKALANDQLKAIREIETYLNIDTKANIYDGDTSQYLRKDIRINSKIILTNPYELHLNLQFHTLWKHFFQNLNFIVLDEIHHYRGVFGSNIAYLIRRIKRICNFYGANPQFILSTATIANPKEFGEKLIGENISIIDNDGSPKGEKYFILYNPFFGGIGSGEKSTHSETKELFKYFISHQCQTLCFTISRQMAELIIHWVKEEQPILKDKISVYRAGYLPKERRDIENNFKKGFLKGIASTNALELGIDIGSLDCVLISGYPGTIISTMQQAGRAGRRNKSSVVILIAFENSLDQYIFKHPNVLFDKSPENIIIDTENEIIKAGQLLCAISELPFIPNNEIKYFGENNEEILKNFINEGIVRKTKSGYVTIAKASDFVRIDSMPRKIYKLIYDDNLIETLSDEEVYKKAFKGAVYFHKGETYIVENLDEENSMIELIKKDVDYYTEPIIHVNLEIINVIKNRNYHDTKISFGNVKVKEHILGYKIKKYENVIGMEKLNYEPRVFKTQAFWFSLSNEIKDKINNQKNFSLDGGIHGIEHAMIGIMPLKIMCDRWDLGGISYPLNPQTEKSTIFIYEGIEGGIGLTKKAFEFAEELLQMTYELINNCQCENGCPACIYSPKCGNDNQILHKETSIFILAEILKSHNLL
ncbi:MAG: DEAD/DEAH box helicase [Bacteroidales bacterium]|nr:DEAD/DEAH box helicase [Bacteroidales bacterium]